MCLTQGCNDITRKFHGVGTLTMVCYSVQPMIKRGSYLPNLVSASRNVGWRYIRRKARLYIARTAIGEVIIQQQHLIFWDIPFVGVPLRTGRENSS